MRTQATKDITLTELKQRCAFYGYSVKNEYGEVEAYTKGKRGDASIFEGGEMKNWSLFQTVQADAIARFANQLENNVGIRQAEEREEIKSALLSWYESNGKDWKENLWTAWLSGNYRGHNASGMLQRIRNYRKDLILSLS